MQSILIALLTLTHAETDQDTGGVQVDDVDEPIRGDTDEIEDEDDKKVILPESVTG